MGFLELEKECTASVTKVYKTISKVFLCVPFHYWTNTKSEYAFVYTSCLKLWQDIYSTYVSIYLFSHL